MSIDQYEQHILQIRTWDWQGLIADLEPFEDDCNDIRLYAFIGTVTAIAPSGKYWTAYAHANVDETEAESDETFFRALDAVAIEHGCCYIEQGMDPLDTLLVREIED